MKASRRRGAVFPILALLALGGPILFDGGVGLRFYAPNFVARVDVAFGKEGMGLDFNFGHIF